MSARRASMSWVMRIRCSCVSSQKALKRSVRASIGSSRLGEGLDSPPSAVVGMVGEWRTTRRHLEDRPGFQNEPGTRGAPPHSKANCPIRTSPQGVVHPVCHALLI